MRAVGVRGRYINDYSMNFNEEELDTISSAHILDLEV